MISRRSPRSLYFALYLNAGLLACVLVALLSRGLGGVSPFESAAFAQPAPQAIAGGAGFYLMPAQFGTNSWGCYVMDVDAQTLVAYVYDRPAASSTPVLRLAAARSFVSDRRLRSYNTLPRPDEIEQLLRLERDQTHRPDAPLAPTTDAATATTRPAVPRDD